MEGSFLKGIDYYYDYLSLFGGRIWVYIIYIILESVNQVREQGLTEAWN